jgi:phospholipid-binding lipoprotein MlaA
MRDSLAWLRVGLLATAVVGWAGFAQAQDSKPGSKSDDLSDLESEVDEESDPFEGGNRFFFEVNDALDAIILRPVSVVYKTVVPDFAQDGVHNFLNNLDAPVTFANDVLQGEMDRAGATMARFAINSTVGVGGLIDVASEVGIPGHHEDFGQTLAVWGVDEGAYLYTPLLGPSTTRDLAGSVVDLAFNPLTYLAINDNNNAEWVPYARMGAEAVDLRSRNLEALDNLKRTSVDFYVAIRSAYRQNRKFEINNGGLDDEDLPPIE